VLPLLWAGVWLLHFPLLHLPYYWDEAGYYIPAAYDFFRTGTLIPFSTLSNAHPPLPSILLAACWKLFGFRPFVTRTAMCFFSALALTAVWRLALATRCRKPVAAATVMLTGLYPVFFAQSSLAHADMFAAPATLWALVFFLESRLGLTVLCFALAALAKETAIATPLALALWEFWQALRRPSLLESGARERAHGRSGALLLTPALPLIGWYAYHHHKTGFTFGNPEFLRYNATATLTPLRILLALAHRTMHVTLHMNLFVPFLLMLACLLLVPVKDADGSERARIAGEQQAVLYVVIVANVLFFSVLGGALLTRYLLPLYPLVLLLCVNTFWRRLRNWEYAVAFSAVAFAVGLFVNPPYKFAPEDNLEYATIVRMHQAAIRQIVAHYPHATVLTAWPGTDELRKPELGYVTHPIAVTPIDNFSAAQIADAARMPQRFDVAFLFSTKYDPPHLLLNLGAWNEALDRRYFGYHRDLAPGVIARILGGNLTWRADRRGAWAAVVTFNRPEWADFARP
jgi:Dolichyl-phosphate-mannose-protein mannosyltransferase